MGKRELTIAGHNKIKMPEKDKTADYPVGPDGKKLKPCCACPETKQVRDECIMEKVKGYNFDVLESLQSWIHNLAENMGITVEEAWATPAKSYTMTTYYAGGTLPKDTFDVNIFERNVQVVNMRSIDAPLLIDTIRRGLPEGVTMSIHEHTVEMAEERWIADPFIDSLRSEISAKKDTKEAEIAKKAEAADAKAARKRAELLKSLTDS